MVLTGKVLRVLDIKAETVSELQSQDRTTRRRKQKVNETLVEMLLCSRRFQHDLSPLRDVSWSGHRTQQDILRWKLKELRDLQEAKTFQSDKVEEHLPEGLNLDATQDRAL